jgi:hypothetical protein
MSSLVLRISKILGVGWKTQIEDILLLLTNVSSKRDGKQKAVFEKMS